MRFALFLRGINVGPIKVPMAELRDCLSSMGLEDVATFLQTGNVLFNSRQTAQVLKPALEAELGRRFAYQAFVILRPASSVAEIADACPFEPDDGRHRYAVICTDQAAADELCGHADELDAAVEQIACGDAVVYWGVPKGSTVDSRFGKLIGKPKYKATTTNRNLNTLVKMAQQLSNT